MTIIINDFAKTKAEANKKVKKLREGYKQFYKTIHIEVSKFTPLEHKRDKNIKGYKYHISAKLGTAKRRRKK